MENSGFIKKKYYGMLFAYLFSWFVATFGDLADGILAGILISEEAVAAVELVAPVFSVLMFFSSFVAVGVSTLFVRSMGAFDKKSAYRICGTGLMAAVFIGIVLAAAMYVFEDAFFGFYTSTAVIDGLAREYYECLILLALIYPLYWLIYYLVAADGNPFLCFIATTVNAASNALFSCLLVSHLGIKGLGLGTVIALLAGGATMIIHFFRKSNSVRIIMKIDLKRLVEASAVGSASSFIYLYIGIVDIIINKFLIVHFGDTYLSAYMVVNLVLNLVGCFTSAAAAAGPFVSVGYGEKNPLAIKNIMNFSTVPISVIGVVFSAIVFFAAPLLPQMYGITGPEVFDSAVYAGRVLGISYLATCFVMHWINYLPRINCVLHSNVLAAVYLFISPLVFPMPFAIWWGFKGLVWGFFLTPIVAFLYHFIYVAVKYGLKKFPYMVPETDNKVFIHGLTLNTSEIMRLRDEVERDLSSCGVSADIINKAQLVIEESFQIVRDKNPGAEISGDCTVIVSDSYVRLITRDNGIIFDITDANAKIKSLREYMNACLNESGLESTYLTTTTFNRNSYIWELNK